MLTRLSLITLIACLAACSEKPAAPQSSPEPAAPAAAAPEALPRSASKEGASVFFISPADGETLTNPVRVEFGIEGMDVVRAGENQPHSGHHHLLIDTGLPAMDLPIPADDHHVHFGDGSTSTEITLPPGEHSLQMLLGDYLHIPHDPPLASEVITITVE